MVSSLPHNRLTVLQRDLLASFFARDQRTFLTGGAALAGFYLGHRSTDDLDLFAFPGVDLTATLTCIDSENYGSRFGEAAVFGLMKRLVCASRLDIQISATELRCIDIERAFSAAAVDCGADIHGIQSYPDFRRLVVERKGEMCKIDLVIDRAPSLEQDKIMADHVRLDSMREIAANKICALVSRSEIRDLIDLRALLHAGIDLERACADALVKK